MITLSALPAQSINTPTTSVSNKPLLPQLDNNREFWEDINQEYGLSDMDVMVGIHGDLEVSVDDEYTSYITAPLSHHPIDFVNYWDVCLLLCLFIPLFFMCFTDIPKPVPYVFSNGHGLLADSSISSAL